MPERRPSQLLTGLESLVKRLRAVVTRPEERTPGQIYDENVRIRSRNSRRYNSDWTDQQISDDCVQVFGTREEFIREQIGHDDLPSYLPQTTEQAYNENRSALNAAFKQTRQGISDEEADRFSLGALGPMDEWMDKQKKKRADLIRSHYKSSKEFLGQLINHKEISRQEYVDRLRKLEEWSDSQEI